MTTATAPATSAGPTHFVILHTQVGATFHRGDVVPADAVRESVLVFPREADPDNGLFRPITPEQAEAQTRANIQRLLDIGALRPATPFEANQSHVTLADQAPSAPLEQVLHERTQEVERLKVEVASLREQVRQLTEAPPAPVVQVPSIDNAQRAEMARCIGELRESLEAERRARAELEARLAGQGQPQGDNEARKRR